MRWCTRCQKDKFGKFPEPTRVCQDCAKTYSELRAEVANYQVELWEQDTARLCNESRIEELRAEVKKSGREYDKLWRENNAESVICSELRAEVELLLKQHSGRQEKIERFAKSNHDLIATVAELRAENDALQTKPETIEAKNHSHSVYEAKENSHD